MKVDARNMRHLRNLLPIAAAFAVGAASQPALALQTEFIATGTISGGAENLSGLFGSSDLTGDSFVAKFYVDTSNGITNEDSYSESVYGGQINGYSYSEQSPVFTTLTIDGYTVSFDNGSESYSQAYVQSYPGTTPFNGSGQVSLENTQDFGVGGVNQILVSVGSGEYNYFPSQIGQAFAITDPNIFSYGGQGGGFFSVYGSNGGTGGDLVVETVSSPGIISAAPEPSTWALMIAGLASIGLALRGRRRPTAAGLA